MDVYLQHPISILLNGSLTSDVEAGQLFLGAKWKKKN